MSTSHVGAPPVQLDRQDTPRLESRRDRMRAAACEEILAAARALLAGGGTGAVSLRAIAREVGVAPAALYHYFSNLDELVSALCVRLYDEVRVALEQARDDAAEDPYDRIVAVCRGLRRWALTHPTEFGLLYGATPEAVTPARRRAAARLAGVFADLLDEVRPQPGPAFVGYWTRLCGLVAMEAFGHVRFAVDDAELVFEAELVEMARGWTPAGPWAD